MGNAIIIRTNGISKDYVDIQDSKKVDKENGKMLSSNDFTDYYKYKIECLYMKPRIHLYIADGVGGCYMEDYGKTWALTKEELEKQE